MSRPLLSDVLSSFLLEWLNPMYLDQFGQQFCFDLGASVSSSSSSSSSLSLLSFSSSSSSSLFSSSFSSSSYSSSSSSSSSSSLSETVDRKINYSTFCTQASHMITWYENIIKCSKSSRPLCLFCHFPLLEKVSPVLKSTNAPHSFFHWICFISAVGHLYSVPHADKKERSTQEIERCCRQICSCSRCKQQGATIECQSKHWFKPKDCSGTFWHIPCLLRQGGIICFFQRQLQGFCPSCSEEWSSLDPSLKGSVFFWSSLGINKYIGQSELQPRKIEIEPCTLKLDRYMYTWITFQEYEQLQLMAKQVQDSSSSSSSSSSASLSSSSFSVSLLSSSCSSSSSSSSSLLSSSSASLMDMSKNEKSASEQKIMQSPFYDALSNDLLFLEPEPNHHYSVSNAIQILYRYIQAQTQAQAQAQAQAILR